MPDAEIRDVHRTTATFAITFLLAEQFADHAINVLFERGFEQILVLVGLAMRHAAFQLLVAHFADGDRAFREAFAVAAMRAGDFVADVQHRARARRRAFLPDRNVRRPAIIKITYWLIRAGTQLDDHLLQLADHQHIFEQVNRLVLGDALLRKFLFQISFVAVGGNFAAINFIRRELRPHVAQIILRSRFAGFSRFFSFLAWFFQCCCCHNFIFRRTGVAPVTNFIFRSKQRQARRLSYAQIHFKLSPL